MSGTRKAVDLDLVARTVLYLQTESRRLAREQSARVGLSPTQINILKMLDEIGEISLSELGRRIAVQSSTVTGIVDRLTLAGLVSREQSAEDRRVWRIRLTLKGRTLARDVEVAPWDILRRALEAMPRDQQRQLLELVSVVARNVEHELAAVAAVNAEGDPDAVHRRAPADPQDRPQVRRDRNQPARRRVGGR